MFGILPIFLIKFRDSHTSAGVCFANLVVMTIIYPQNPVLQPAFGPATRTAITILVTRTMLNIRGALGQPVVSRSGEPFSTVNTNVEVRRTSALNTSSWRVATGSVVSIGSLTTPDSREENTAEVTYEEAMRQVRSIKVEPISTKVTCTK